MMRLKIIKRIVKAKSIKAFIEDMGETYDTEAANETVEILTRLRFKYDFPFGTATLVYIKNKDIGKPNDLPND